MVRDTDRHLERVFADPPTESDILGHPIDSERDQRRAWKIAGFLTIAACIAGTLATVAYVAFAFGFGIA